MCVFTAESLSIKRKMNIFFMPSVFSFFLTAGSLYGVWGVLLGIPIYASVKVVVREIFDWYRSISNLYQDDLENEGQKDDVK